MELLVWIGAGISVVGLAGIVWSIFAVASARKAGLDDDALRARMSRILPINIGALLLSIVGLLLVLVGVILT